MSPRPAAPDGGATRNGLAAALGAYLVWGLLPLYFKLLADVPAIEVVANRILWSLVLLIPLLGLRRHYGALGVALRTPRLVGPLAVTALLIGLNWVVYVWAVGARHLLAASLGYFLTPLANVALGALVLKERLHRTQVAAILLAAAGVAVLAAGELPTLWISLTLAMSFGLYGLLRKIVAVTPAIGLTIETMVLLPAALGWLAHQGAAGTLALASGTGTAALLAGTGVLTTVPLLLFAFAARRIRLGTLGLLQYLSPSLQFVIGALLFGERLSTERLLCFIAIWAALLLYATDSLRLARRA